MSALADAAPELQYKLTVSDGSGKEIKDLSALAVGDNIHVKVVLSRSDIAGSYKATGVQFMFKTNGLDYNNDNVRYHEDVRESFRHWENQKDEHYTLDISLVDFSMTGIEITNPVTAVDCSLKVTDPKSASIVLTTALVYIGSEGYVPSGDMVLTLDANGGTISGADVSGSYMTGASVTLPSAVRDGYNFKGWTDGSATWQAGGNYTVKAAVTLRAVWECRHESSRASYENILTGANGAHRKTTICNTCSEVLSTVQSENCTFTSTVATKATCTSDGVRIHSCKYCSNSYLETIPGGHDYKATCETDRNRHWIVCSVCKTEQLAAGMNTWSDNLDTTAWYYLHIQEASNNHSYERSSSVESWSAKLADIDWEKYNY